jgi:hypothetical protein
MAGIDLMSVVSKMEEAFAIEEVVVASTKRMVDAFLLDHGGEPDKGRKKIEEVRKKWEEMIVMEDYKSCSLGYRNIARIVLDTCRQVELIIGDVSSP